MKNKNEHQIKFSIIIATLNRGNDLARFLTSIKEIGILGRHDVEVIIVDNSGDISKTKETREICASMGAICGHENQKGKPYAINTGIRMARGTYLAFTDDDVIIKNPEWLEVMAKKFKKHPLLGYVSGNVIAMSQESESEKVWEKKGGLSKGGEEKYWSRSFLSQFIFKFKPWQFNKMCAGANSMVPKKVMDKIGGFNILLESGIIGHGTTLEIGYQIAIIGYELLYTPSSVVYHKHPDSAQDLNHKMYIYGIGDTAYHMCIFLEHGDWRSIWWSLTGHPIYTIKNKLIPRILGKYPFPIKYILNGLRGNIVGGYLFLYDYYLRGGKKRKLDYLQRYSHV